MGLFEDLTGDASTQKPTEVPSAAGALLLGAGEREYLSKM